MKMLKLVSILPGLFLMAGCQQNCSDVVCETYVHRYGVPLDPDDWSERGQHGQVISTRKDGVVVSKTYNAGILNGETTYTFPHRDAIAKKEIYAQGDLVQEVYYYPNGLPHKQVAYEAPAAQSVLTWYDSGAPQTKELYAGGRLVQGEYLNPAQQQESAVVDQNGLRTLRDDDGQLIAIDEIQDGSMVLRRNYYPNGAPSAVTPYVDGVIEGTRWTYQMGGEPATEEEWSRNYQHGNTAIYENGEKVADLPYVNGQIQGVERRYRDGQILVEENNWAQGTKHGPCHVYVNGTTQTNWYFRGRQVSRSAYEALGNQGN